MTKIINFGSINIDYVYQVPHFVQPGETLGSSGLQTGLGGKGANQSVAIARAGIDVTHFGRLCKAHQWALEIMRASGVDTGSVELVDGSSGHAIIQVDAQGENSIILFGGANQEFTADAFAAAIDSAPDIEYLLMQNECNLLAEALDIAINRGIKVVLNPAPMTDSVNALPLDKLDTLIVNQVEAQALSGETEPDMMLQCLSDRIPNGRVVITLGAEGAIMHSQGQKTTAASPHIQAVDTTAAGDTFVGYFLAGLSEGMDEHESLTRACRAAALTATREGAISAIPQLEDLEQANLN